MATLLHTLYESDASVVWQGSQICMHLYLPCISTELGDDRHQQGSSPNTSHKQRLSAVTETIEVP